MTLIQFKPIDCFARCACGAVTVYFKDGTNVSLREENCVKFGITLEGEEELNQHCNCNHCANHWGLDLCACGSGESPEDCDNHLPECGNPFYSAEDCIWDSREQHESTVVTSHKPIEGRRWQRLS